MSRRGPARPRIGRSTWRSLARKGGAVFLFLLLAWSGLAIWFVHHPRAWLESWLADHPFIATPLVWLGEPVSDVTDGLGLTGHDLVVTTDRPCPEDNVLFAGEPRRIGEPAPADLSVITQGEFRVAWSPGLRHPVWCAYHVPARARFEAEKRPPFKADRTVPRSPDPRDYTHSRFDRGHLVPNYAIATRFGKEQQAKTFLMSNIAPQRPTHNRCIWRDLEHRIAELWTARWGEIWVIVGCLSESGETLGESGIDIPSHFYQIVVAQKDDEIRAQAVLIEQDATAMARPARYLVSIDELERRSGFDFLPDLDDALEERLEAEVPTRLWPIRLRDAIDLIRLRAED